MEKDRYDKAPARLHTPAFLSKNLTSTAKLRLLQSAAFITVRMGERNSFTSSPEVTDNSRDETAQTKWCFAGTVVVVGWVSRGIIK